MKRLENLNSLKTEQILSLAANRGSCIVSNILNTPTFEFVVYESEGVTILGVDDSKQVNILPLSEAMKLEGYLSANLGTPVSNVSGAEAKLEYIVTAEMDLNERERWEVKNSASVTDGDNGGLLELQRSYYYSTDDNGNKIPGSEIPTLSIAMCDDMGEEEICFTVSSKDAIRKLRDYLNNYLEGNLG